MFFRGAGAAARAYLESDHSHADEYYLEDVGAVASWTALAPDGAVLSTTELDGADYQAWVDWKDPATGLERGTPRDEVRLRVDGEVRITPSSPRFVEMTVNCDKSLSVAAALDPAVSQALDAAQASAAEAMNTYMAAHSVTRVGARGAQRLVPVERLESVSVVHRSSRAGDPHRHVHVQWNTRVFAEGKWRGLHTAATLKQQGALRGVGEAAINSHAQLRQALAAAGFEFDAATGTVTNLAAHAKVMSKRAQQIDRNVLLFEAEWRAAHPGQEPDAALRRQWDQQAWALERPRKRQIEGRPENKWIEELQGAGLPVDGFTAVAPRSAVQLHELDRDALRQEAIAAVENQGSAWSLADLTGRVGEAVARYDVTADARAIDTYVQGLAGDIARALPTLETEIMGEIPTWVRNITSDRVLRVERELKTAFETRGMQSGLAFGDNPPQFGTLDAAQSTATVAIASDAPLVVVEGAAGAGKTTMLGVARDLAKEQGRSLIVVAPTLRAAQEASAALQTRASSAHKVAHEYGFRWTDDGRWRRLRVGDIEPGGVYRGPHAEWRLSSTSRIVIDEAGMLDQDLAHALMTIADETGAGVALIGDRAQLPAVGRGGVLDLAGAASPRPIDLTEVHRFKDKEYAELTIAMRDRHEPGTLFDQLHARGNVTIHATDAESWAAISADVVRTAEAGASVAVAVTSNDAATQLNSLVQHARARAGHTRTPAVEVAGSDGLNVRVGDRIMTRLNKKQLGVANRDTWTVKRVHRDGSITVVDKRRKARLPADYVEAHTHLAYASTEYGVQGATVDVGHGIVTDSSSAQAVYVPATRGREHNTLHLVAGDVDEARSIFTGALRRESGDRGVEAARENITRDLNGIVLPAPGVETSLRAERLATAERVYTARVREWELATANWEKRHPGISAADPAAGIAALEQSHAAAAATVTRLENELVASADHTRTTAWTRDYNTVNNAHTAAANASMLRRRSAQEAYETARRDFSAAHGHEPTPHPPQRVRDTWQAEAIVRGRDPRLDAARKQVEEARTALDRLRRDPAPTKPPAPTVGTAAQEATKDTRYLHRKNQIEQRRDPKTIEPRTPRVPTRGLER